MILGYLILMFPMMLALSCIVYLPFCLYRRKHFGRQPFLRHCVVLLLLVTIFSLIYITIFLSGSITFQPEYYRLNLKPFAWIESIREVGAKQSIQQYLLNIMMFIPFGVFLPLVFYPKIRFLKTLGYSLLFTSCIETFQYFIGRSSDIDDVIANILGAVTGYFIFFLGSTLFCNFTFWKKLCGQFPKS